MLRVHTGSPCRFPAEVHRSVPQSLPRGSAASRQTFNNSKSTFYLQWHLHRLRKNPLIDPRSSTRCLAAWEKLGGQGNPEIVIGFTDEGCDLGHPDWGGESGLPSPFPAWGYWEENRFYTCGSPGADPRCMNQPAAIHGTACAGVAAAPGLNGGPAGAAPGCSLLPVKWEKKGAGLRISEGKFLRVLDYIADKVDILFNAWSFLPDRDWSRRVTRRIAGLARCGGRRKKGILFLFAAGNENCPLNSSVTGRRGKRPYPGNTAAEGVRWASRFRRSLCGTPGVLYVGAVSSLARRCHYSNYGRGLDLCAPSNNYHTFRQHAPGFFASGSIRGLGLTIIPLPDNAMGAGFGGTSAATALAAGVAALVMSANSGLQAVEVGEILKSTAAKDLNREGYPSDPASLYDLPPAKPYERGEVDGEGWSPWFGYGRIDALDAVTRALALKRDNNTE